MKKTFRCIVQTSVMTLVGVCMALPSWADKPEWAGHDRERGRHEQREERREEGRRDQYQGAQARYGERESYQRRPMVELRFGDEDRHFIHDYYSDQWRAGRCPPGLAKKHNGCLPPGQARLWRMGYPLPADLRRYPLPPEVLIRLPMPPAGHEFVRVASDILLIAVGSGMVVDAIQDLGR